MEIIVNGTRHEPTEAQKEAGVVQPPAEHHEQMVDALTFAEKPATHTIAARVARFAEALKATVDEIGGVDAVMIGGAPYMMRPLEEKVLKYGIEPVYAFTQREIEEVQTDDGVEKRTIFRHEGFVSPHR